MKITFSPVRRDEQLALHRAGDVLTINGEPFDFGPLPEGATLPLEAIDSDCFAGPVERIEGELHLTLVLPHGPRAPEGTRFPAPLVVTEDGLIDVPAWSVPQLEEKADGQD
jgi:hypothetical protein